MTLDASRWQRIEGLFDQALELPHQDRTEWLEHACADDAALFSEVSNLVKANDRADDFLEKDFVACIRESAQKGQLNIPTQLTGLDHHRVLELLGRGGMGQVYLAEQTDVGRKVALKVIRAEIEDEETRARFESEFRLLARMEHQHIARIYETGYTDSLPFFTMEYFPGQPLNTFVSEQALDLKQRIHLFLDICEGIRHAHLKGIIHRDLKPSNILAAMGESGPVIKIIDFGIARLQKGEFTGEGLTRKGVILGTPAYMSPEQIEGIEVDTRVDIYGLGALLFELLTGTPPVDVERLDDMSSSQKLKFLLETSPGLASENVQIAEIPARALQGELDWVVLKAMEKDVNRRYDGVSALISDLKAWLEDRPVSARPPSPFYLAGKFLRRHHLLASAVLFIFLGLTAGLILVDRARREAEAARKKETQATLLARKKQLEAKDTLDFLVSTLSSADPRLQGRDVKILDVMPSIEALEAAYSDKPGVFSSLAFSLGKVYLNLGERDTAQAFFEKDLEALLSSSAQWGDPGEYGQHALEVRERIAYLHSERGEDMTLARDMYQAVIEDSCPGESQLFAMRGLADWFRREKRFDESIALYKEIFKEHMFMFGEEHILTLQTAHGLGIALRKDGELDEAEWFFNWVRDLQDKTLGPDHYDTLRTLNDLGNMAFERKEYEAALHFYEAGLGPQRDSLGINHPDTTLSMYNICFILQRLGRCAEAISLCELALKGREHSGGRVEILQAKQKLALCYRDTGHKEEALALFKEIIEGYEDLGLENQALRARSNLASSQYDWGEYEEVVDLCRDIMSQQTGRNKMYTRATLAQALMGLRRWEEALPHLTDSFQALKNDEVQAYLGYCLMRLDRLKEAEVHLLNCHKNMTESKDKALPVATGFLVELYEAWNKPEKAARFKSNKQ